MSVAPPFIHLSYLHSNNFLKVTRLHILIYEGRYSNNLIRVISTNLLTFRVSKLLLHVPSI